MTEKTKALNQKPTRVAGDAFEAILADVRAGTAVRTAITTHGVNSRAFYEHLDADADAAKRYAIARESSMDAIADEAMRIADDPEIDPNHKRIMVDSRKWFLSKLAPKKYGDKLAVGGDADMPAVQVLARVERVIVRPPN